MSGRYLFGLTILLITTFCLADHHFTCSSTSVCAGDTITCNCTLESDTDYVVWSVRDGAGNTVGSPVRLNSTNYFYTSWINMGNFTFYYTDDYSLASMMVSPQNNNYRIVCSLPPDENSTLEDAVYSNAFNVTPVQSLENLMLEFENVSRSYVTVNWTDSDDDCEFGYNVNVSRDNGPAMTYYTEDSDFILTNANSSVLYTFRVMPAGVVRERLLNDLASMPQSIRLDVPVPVTNVRVTHMPIAMNAQDGTSITVTVRWDVMNANRPRTMYYYITHNATRHLEGMGSGMGSGSGSMSDDDVSPSVFVTRRRMARRMGNSQQLLGAVVGETYTVSIIGENDIGNSTAATLTFTLTYMPQPTTTSVGMTSTPTSTLMPSTSPTMDDDDDESLPTWAIAVIAVGGGILLAVIIAVLVLVICCCCCAVAAAKRNEEHEMTEGTKL